MTTSEPVSPNKKSFLDTMMTNILPQSTRDNRNDPFRFQVGVNFKAKIIGIDDVPEARGDRMCQEAIQKQKLAVKAKGEHKQRIIINVSLEGIKIIDELSMNAIHQHAVHRISFISRDVSDARAFGYIYGPGDGSHKFFGIKTEKAAENLVLTLRDLFQVVFEMKKKETEDRKKQDEKQDTKEEAKSVTLQKKQEEGVTESSTEESGKQTDVIEQEKPKEQLADLFDFGAADLNVLQQNINEIDSFDPIDNKPANAGFGGTPQHKNPPLSLENDDPFVVNSPTSGLSTAPATGGGNWAQISSPNPAQSTGAMFGMPTQTSSAPSGMGNQPFSPTSPSSNMFGAQGFGAPAPQGLVAPASSPFAGPVPGGPFGAPSTAPGPFSATSPAGAFGPPGTSPFGAPSTTGGFGAPSFAAPPMANTMGNTMGGGMPAQNGPSANPFLSSAGGSFGGPSDMSAVSNGFGSTLSPTPAPGSQKEEPKSSADPLFGDLVGSFSADLGKKKKEEFFKPGPSPIVKDMMQAQPQVSGEEGVCENDPFKTTVFSESDDNHIFNQSINFTDSDTNSPDQDIPAPSIPPPPLPQNCTFFTQQPAPSIPPRPANAGRQTSSTSLHSSTALPVMSSLDFSKFAEDVPPAPPPRPGSHPPWSMTSQLSCDSSKNSPTLPRQTSQSSVSGTPPVLPLRKQTSVSLQKQGSTPPALPTTSPPQLTAYQPPSGGEDSPPPPPPRPGLESRRAPMLSIALRSMTVPEQTVENPMSRPRPRPNTPSGTNSDVELALTNLKQAPVPAPRQGADPFAVTLPKPRPRNVDASFARPRPRPRSKTPTASLTSSEFSFKTESAAAQNAKLAGEVITAQNDQTQSATANLEFQFESKQTDSPSGSLRLGHNRDGYSSDHRTATPVSIHSGHSASSGDQIVDPFANVDPFEKDGGDPFACKDPFQDKDPFSEDPFSDADVFGQNSEEFQTKAVSAEGVPLRAESCANERRKKLTVNTDVFASDPFSLTIDPLPGKKLDTPLIGDGSKRGSRKSDPFDTAFAAATLNSTSFSPQFNNCDMPAVQNTTTDIFSHHIASEFNATDSPVLARNIQTAADRTSDSPFSSSATSYQSPPKEHRDLNHNDQANQHESDSTSYSSEVCEAFATTPRSATQHSSTPGFPNGSGVMNGRGTPGNPFLPQPSVPIPPQAPQPPPPGATLLDF